MQNFMLEKGIELIGNTHILPRTVYLVTTISGFTQNTACLL